MKTVFIVEGPDCSGKTSLCAAIARLKQAAYIHSSGDRAFHPIMGKYHETILDVVEKNLAHGQHVVLDRFWPSELVYGTLLRPTVSDRAYDYRSILRRLRGMSVVYVFCGDPGMAARHKEQQDPSHPYDEGTYTSICGEYRNLELQMKNTEAPLQAFSDGPELFFEVVHYSIAEHGHAITEFVDTL